MSDGPVDARTERERKFFGLQTSTERLLGAESREETARIAVDAARDVLDAELAGFHLHDDGVLRPLAWLDTVRDELGDPPVYRRDRGGRADRVVWATFQAGEPVVIEDTRAFDPELAAGTPTRSGVIHPLGDEGVFIVSATEPHAFDEADLAFVRTLTNALRAALDQVGREALLRERERELSRQNERLEEFTSMVSHDLRSPLSVADGRVELARKTTDDQTVDDHLAAADRALDQMDELVDHLLTLARQGRTIGETEPVALAAAARNAWTAFDDEAGLGVALDDVTVEADRERLRQVFANLFRNAVEHGSTGSNQLTVTVGLLADGSGFYVADDGPGIPESERERVFEAGYSTADDGTGFGLAIARGAVEAHGWELGATESASGGARFEVRTRPEGQG